MIEEEIKQLLGQKIKFLRNKLDLTQFTLGEMVDINQRQIAVIESGKSFPSLRTLKKLADIFNCEIQDLFNFNHLQSADTLRTEIKKILDNSSYSKLQIIYLLAKELV